MSLQLFLKSYELINKSDFAQFKKGSMKIKKSEKIYLFKIILRFFLYLNTSILIIK